MSLRLRQFKAGEEVHDLASVVERHTDPVVQKREDQDDLDTEFGATVPHCGGQGKFFRIRPFVNMIRNVDGFSVDDSPHKLSASQLTFLRIHTLWKNLLLLRNAFEFRLLFLPSAFASRPIRVPLLLVPFVSIEAEVWRLRRFGRRLLLEQFLQSNDFTFEHPDLPSLLFDQFGLLQDAFIARV